MPLPLILGIGAAVAGLAGVGSGIHGGVKMKEANDTMKLADSRHKANIARFEERSKLANDSMDKLRKTELDILKSFEDFANVFEKIQNRPQFKSYSKGGVNIPEYNSEELKSIGGTIVASIGGGVMGTMVGSTILTAPLFGVGLLVSGIVFNVKASSLSNEAEQVWEQVKKEEREINKICEYLNKLATTAQKYTNSLQSVQKMYQRHLNKLREIVVTNNKTDWNSFYDYEKTITENTVLVVGLLYNMCKVQLVLKADDENGLNKVNVNKVEKSIRDAEAFKRSIHYSDSITAQEFFANR